MKKESKLKSVLSFVIFLPIVTSFVLLGEIGYFLVDLSEKIEKKTERLARWLESKNVINYN